ncbi:hypothetical protein BLA29_002448 [Euroglyphus maynei]|uniref:Uncharacterized protein n=1 Tax=Euroglyphus maynei TaxID=6958 RepID=A0A1Y3BEJ1_EURMA|nr:hypothetical protein BLA29_002448 [Euroglyphus maynei]
MQNVDKKLTYGTVGIFDDQQNRRIKVFHITIQCIQTEAMLRCRIDQRPCIAFSASRQVFHKLNEIIKYNKYDNIQQQQHSRSVLCRRSASRTCQSTRATLARWVIPDDNVRQNYVLPTNWTPSQNENMKPMNDSQSLEQMTHIPFGGKVIFHKLEKMQRTSTPETDITGHLYSLLPAVESILKKIKEKINTKQTKKQKTSKLTVEILKGINLRIDHIAIANRLDH